MIAYEQKLRDDLRWGFMEGSRHFEKESTVHETLRKVTKRLDQLGIPYAVVGGMALFFHGYRRFTDDVNLLVTREGLQQVHESLEGRGYLSPFSGSKQLRDTDTGVKVEFLTTGDYPRDGKPKPVAFPNPEEARVEIDGIQFLQLAKIVELKLASGMTNSGRLKDLGDVQELIRTLQLPKGLAEQLNPFVQDKYKELWAAVHNNPTEP